MLMHFGVKKKIVQYKNNEPINNFETMSEAAEWIIENGYSKGQIKHIVSNISKNARGLEHRNQAYGFQWRCE